MANSKLRLVAGFWLSCISLVCADQKQLGADSTFIKASNGEWRLEAKQADLSKLLDGIGVRTKTKVHYSVLPEAAIDAICVGATAVQLLQCLLGNSVNMAFRHAEAENANGAKVSHSEEIWILGSSLTRPSHASAQCVPVSQALDSVDNDKADLTEQWLKQAKAKDAKQRAQAIAELVNADPAFDVKVRATLQKALSDSQPQVRAQAISTWASREGELAAAEQLRQALSDSNNEVRLMAIDYIEKDTVLLQQASLDIDPAVRVLAEKKLELLSKQ